MHLQQPTEGFYIEPVGWMHRMEWICYCIWNIVLSRGHLKPRHLGCVYGYIYLSLRPCVPLHISYNFFSVSKIFLHSPKNCFLQGEYFHNQQIYPDVFAYNLFWRGIWRCGYPTTMALISLGGILILSPKHYHNIT